MTIAVVFALDAEWAPWRSRHAFRPAAAGSRIYEGSVGRTRARVALGGVGAPNVRALVDALCAGTPGSVDAVLAAGLAGALRDSCLCRDVIVARRVRSVPSGSSVASQVQLVEAASRSGARIVEVLLSADRVAGSVEEKRRLAAQGEAVDMESFRVLEEARRRGIPSVAIRVIGDAADEALPLDFNRAVRGDGSVNVLNLVGQAIRIPHRWTALACFAYRQHRAIGELAGFLDRFVSSLGASGE